MNGYTGCCMRIADHYGYDLQAGIAMEELAELIVAISKYTRRPDIEHKEAVAEEIADVEIMIDQIKYLLNIYDSDIDEYKHDKIERQFARIKEETDAAAGK